MLYVVYRKALIEAAELVDGDLIGTARVAVQLASNTPLSAISPPALLARDRYETPLVVQFWSREGLLLAHLGPEVQMSTSPRQSGFTDLDIGGRKWRTYSIINNSGTAWVCTMVTADGRDPSAGSGLGLAIVHRILLLHRAKISVTASEHNGAIFTVRLRSTESRLAAESDTRGPGQL